MKRATIGLILLLAGGCVGKIGPSGGDLGSTSERPTFEQFRADALRDEDGGFIFDGDMSAPDEPALRALYEALFPERGALIVQNYGGRDRVWDTAQRHQLTYCVSDSFGSRHGMVLDAMQRAADEWMAVADVSFQYAAEQDGDCTASNGSVLFDVRPTNDSSYLARAFFPGYARRQRNVLVSVTAFRSSTPLVGVLRHELGHVLGFLHEHIRRPGTPCPEGGSYRGVTDYDPGSVMHYPQCGGSNFRLELSELDVAGAQAVYGPPVGAPAETPPSSPPSSSPAPSPTGTARTGSANGSVAAGEQSAFQPLTVSPGSAFSVAMSGTGDADLYVRFDAAPTTSAYDCRPYAGDADERCDLTVPEGATEAFIMVHGYSAASFRIEVSWVAP